MSPCNLDSSLWIISLAILHDVLCKEDKWRWLSELVFPFVFELGCCSVSTSNCLLVNQHTDSFNSLRWSQWTFSLEAFIHYHLKSLINERKMNVFWTPLLSPSSNECWNLISGLRMYLSVFSSCFIR